MPGDTTSGEKKKKKHSKEVIIYLVYVESHRLIDKASIR